MGWGPAVNNLAQLPTSFIPAAGLYFRERKEISFPVTWQEIFFSIPKNVTTGSGAYPALIQCAPEVKRPKRQADHLSQCSTVVRNDLSDIPKPHTYPH